MPSTSMHPVPKPSPDLTSRAYWNGTIKMSLSKLFILRVLCDRPMHGYDIARTVEQTTNGCCSPSEGTIYPVLRDFEENGLVTHETDVVSGRERKVYTLTDKGREALRVAVDAWIEITDALVAADKVVPRTTTPGSACCG
ncbi:lineage-specific thermal regulator protein [Pleomorphomonas sp. SM30]|uniref:PadR family transcriptional regulator n=2 Tax=Oharaeibacter diazotrophicus TaxID=1920512 RepID=A0A4R6RME8_9HYPH|nr:PadR family transcriptional regulator [Oharaeibacter diazotrophicus]BBE70721.1 lineage-specific thermal regulator protein [Pleomorphomonas sp. SM30]